MKSIKPKKKVMSKAAADAKVKRDTASKASKRNLLNEIKKGDAAKKLLPKIYRESQIEKAVCEYGNSVGLTHYKFTSPSRRAVPDQMFIAKGGFVFFIEFKATGKATTVPQAREHEKLRLQGCHVFVVNDITFGKGIIDGMIEGLKP